MSLRQGSPVPPRHLFAVARACAVGLCGGFFSVVPKSLIDRSGCLIIQGENVVGTQTRVRIPLGRRYVGMLGRVAVVLRNSRRASLTDFGRRALHLPRGARQSATRNTSARVVSPRKALARPSSNMVFIPRATAASRIASVSRRVMIMARI